MYRNHASQHIDDEGTDSPHRERQVQDTTGLAYRELERNGDAPVYGHVGNRTSLSSRLTHHQLTNPIVPHDRNPGLSSHSHSPSHSQSHGPRRMHNVRRSFSDDFEIKAETQQQQQQKLSETIAAFEGRSYSMTQGISKEPAGEHITHRRANARIHNKERRRAMSVHGYGLGHRIEDDEYERNPRRLHLNIDLSVNKEKETEHTDSSHADSKEQRQLPLRSGAIVILDGDNNDNNERYGNRSNSSSSSSSIRENRSYTNSNGTNTFHNTSDSTGDNMHDTDPRSDSKRSGINDTSSSGMSGANGSDFSEVAPDVLSKAVASMVTDMDSHRQHGFFRMNRSTMEEGDASSHNSSYYHDHHQSYHQHQHQRTVTASLSSKRSRGSIMPKRTLKQVARGQYNRKQVIQGGSARYQYQHQHQHPHRHSQRHQHHQHHYQFQNQQRNPTADQTQPMSGNDKGK